MFESELLYCPYYYLQAKGSVPIKEYHRWTIQQAHKRTYNRYCKVPSITEPREELFTLKTI